MLLEAVTLGVSAVVSAAVLGVAVRKASAEVAGACNRAVDALAGFWASAGTEDLVDIEDLFSAEWAANPEAHEYVLESDLIARQEQLPL